MIFDNVTVITMNDRREVLGQAAVRVAGKQIVAVGKSRAVRDQFPEEPVLDYAGHVLMPGLIDTHAHTAEALIRGCADDLTLFDWLGKRAGVLQGHYSEEDARASAQLCLLEMLKSGTTSFIECMLAERYGFDGVAEAVVRSGIRAALAKAIMEQPAHGNVAGVLHQGLLEPGEASVENALAAVARWHGAGEGRVQVWLGPRPPGGATPGMYDYVSRLARDHNIGLTINLAEVRDDLAYAAAQGCRTPVDFAYAHGLLGPRSVLAHCVWTDERDWKLLADTGSHVSHVPTSNAKRASGIAPIAGMLRAGVNVTLGCNGGASNNSYDMLRELRMAGYLAALHENNAAGLTAETVLEMATINGAKALGLEDQIGSIEVGKRADFILIDLDAPHLTPVWDVVSTIAYSAVGADVDTVVIDGELVMVGRQVQTLDEAAILEDVRRRYYAVSERASLAITPRWPIR